MSGVLADGWGTLFNSPSISVFFHACTNLTSYPFVVYFISRGSSGCYNAKFLGDICHQNLTSNEVSKFGPLHPVSVFVFCTFQKKCFWKKSVYVSLIGIFVVYVSLCYLSLDTFSDRASGVTPGPCFCGGVSCGLFYSLFYWCVVLTFSYLFCAREPSFFHNRVPCMPGVSVRFGNWLTCYSALWHPSWYAGALLFGVRLSSFFFISYFFRYASLLFLHCFPKRSGLFIYFYLFPLSNLSMSSDLCFCFSSSTISDF